MERALVETPRFMYVKYVNSEMAFWVYIVQCVEEGGPYPGRLGRGPAPRTWTLAGVRSPFDKYVLGNVEGSA